MRVSARPHLGAQYLHFLLHCKKWWIVPPLALLAALAAAIWLTAGDGVAGFVYDLF